MREHHGRRAIPVRLSSVGSVLAALALLVDSAAAVDPRILLVDKQIERNHKDALEGVERALLNDPQAAHGLGLDYLRGHLLLLLERRQEAQQAFADSMGATPALEAYSRFRLAREEADLHPEVAAGLLATLLGSPSPPRPLIGPAMELLVRAIADGGDCRLLNGLNRQRFSRRNRRLLSLALAECTARGGDRVGAEHQLLRLLEENRNDDVALAAASRIANWLPVEKDARTHLLLGLTFQQHREFTIAIQHLAWTVVRLPNASNITSREAFECRYGLARSHFWQERYSVAAAAFGSLLNIAQSPTQRAQVIYQRARSLELAGALEEAIKAFEQAYQLDPSGRWADAALIGKLRLRWLSGRENEVHQKEALSSLEKLIARRKIATATRALFFLVSSDLVQGRTERAEAWLARISSLGRAPGQELHYWHGRLEEARRQPVKAVRHYLEVLKENPYDPFAKGALSRVQNERVLPVTRAVAAQLASGTDLDDLHVAWLLLGDENSQGRRARHKLEQRLWADQASIPYLRLAREPTADWPLWKAALRQPEEMLLALGIFEEGASVVLRHFPVAQPGLAFTGGLALAQSGETKRALYVAEVLGKRIPDRIPALLLPTAYRRLLFPFGYSYLVLRETERQDVDPYLLASIIREESRFDPAAFSGASARGLTQFILPTARRIGMKVNIGPIMPRDLEKPEIAITLGAAYLRDLSDEFDGDRPQMIAAYNAGEPQAALWRHYCFTGEAEEYLSKVTFRETRGYLNKVLTSHAHYRELYASPKEVDGEPSLSLSLRNPGK